LSSISAAGGGCAENISLAVKIWLEGAMADDAINRLTPIYGRRLPGKPGRA
jgi:hypothetical protein